MKNIAIADMTMLQTPTSSASSPTFREKTEIARSLDRMRADVIELPPIVNEKTDALLVRTIAPIVSTSTLSQCAGYTPESVDTAWKAVSGAKKARLSIAFPTSPAQMEFFCHMKPKAVAEAIPALIARARTYTDDVEFRAIDATRAEYPFLIALLESAIEAGAATVTVCDTASALLPDETAAFLNRLRADIPALSGVRLGAECHNGLGVALACSIAAVRAGADEVKCAAEYADVPTEEEFSAFVRSRGDSCGISCALNLTEISRVTNQIKWLLSGSKTQKAPAAPAAAPDGGMVLDRNATLTDVTGAVRRLGYELSEEDNVKIYEAFTQIAEKKTVGVKELEAIVATSAMQVPPAYRLVSYVVNNGNVIAATAQISLEKDGRVLSGVCIGDGPIDAAFLAIEQIIGHHYELDEFQIQAVTEGREAMGSALVRLRSGGRLYSGNGISTDIIGASIHAYLNALNKIVHEEA